MAGLKTYRAKRSFGITQLALESRTFHPNSVGRGFLSSCCEEVASLFGLVIFSF